jgi:UDP-glucose 4-epimerase
MHKLAGKSILITGGAGFIGSHLVDMVIAESPANVVVVDNLFLGRESNLEQARAALPGFKFYQQDAADYDAMRQILRAEQVDVIFNLAVIPLPTSLERPRWTVDVNVTITTVACELLREGYYQTLIHFSSSEAYGTAQHVPMDEQHPLIPLTPYAASKTASDHIVFSYWRTFGVDAAVLRPFNNFGPRQNDGTYCGIIPIVIRRVLRGEPVEIYGDGEQTRDFIFVRDTTAAAIRCYETPESRGKVVNIASGKEISINELVQVILDVMGVPNHPVRHTPPRAGDVRRHWGGIALAEELLGFRPQVTIHDGLQETVAWYVERCRP